MPEAERGKEPTRRNWASFWSLMGLQTQNAFNDKAVQFLLVPLGVWLSAEALGSAESVEGVAKGQAKGVAGIIEYLLAGLIVTPFVLFAPVAGWVSDYFSKQRVIQFFAWFQIMVLVLILVAVRWHLFSLAVGCFFLLAVQSTFLGPAKLGILKELVGSKRLGFASGMMEMFTILAILAGTILMGFWFDARLKQCGDGWEAGLIPAVVLAFAAIGAIVAAHSIERTPRHGREGWSWAIPVRHFEQMAEVLRHRPLRLSALGVAYFWGFGGILQLVSVQICRDLTFGHGAGFATALAWMMLAAGGGIALGSVAASLISRRHIELGLIPLGGVMMTVATLCLGFAEAATPFFYASLGGAGFGAAFFLVPVNAFLQDSCEPDRRGSVLAGSNLLNCIFGLLAVALQLGLKSIGLSPAQQFLLISLTALLATVYVVRLLPREFVRLLVLSTIRTIYRIKVYHDDRMPEGGGVLLTPNHVSYVDALILSAASPRPVRFLMTANCVDTPLVGAVARLFDTVPISPHRAKEAIRIAADAVDEGTVVCIFPEGTLTRDGFLGELKKGFELIARRAECPVVAVYMDGLWGSIFSCERGRFFWKLPRRIPYGVRVVFGEPRGAGSVTPAGTRAELELLAGEMLAQREEVTGTASSILHHAPRGEVAASWWDGAELRSCCWRELCELVSGQRTPPEIAGEVPEALRWLEAWLELAGRSEEEVRDLVIGALQVAEPLDLGHGSGGILLGGDTPPGVREVWGMILPALTKNHVLLAGERRGLVRALEAGRVRDAVGGAGLEGDLAGIESVARGIRMFRFSEEPQGENDAALKRYACRAVAGRVVSLSVPDAPDLRSTDDKRPGAKAGSYGRLLPGCVGSSRGRDLEVTGPGGESLATLAGWRIDEEGFLFGPGSRSGDAPVSGS